MAWTSVLPTPFSPKITSTMAEPPISAPIWKPMTEMTGINALRSAWRKTTRRSHGALGAGGPDVVLLQDLQHHRARHAHQDGHELQAMAATGRAIWLRLPSGS